MKKNNIQHNCFLIFLALFSISIIWLSFKHPWTKLSNVVIVEPTKVKFYDSDELKELEMNQILRGDFTSLEGIWRSQSGIDNGIQFLIRENCVLIDEKRYFLNLQGRAPYSGIYLTRPEKTAAASLIIYPKGVAIPIIDDLGRIDLSGGLDPTDQTKIRILMAQSVLNREEVKRLTTYLVE